jgi:hypothetical protein
MAWARGAHLGSSAVRWVDERSSPIAWILGAMDVSEALKIVYERAHRVRQGILSHVAGPTTDGWRVIDLRESEQAFQRFGEVIGPVLQDVGFPGEPEMFPLHTFVS